jgi:hypothetical protein
MKLTTWERLILGLTVLLFVGWFAYGLVVEHDLRVKAEAATAADAQVIAAKDQAIAATNAAAATANAALQHQSQALKTPQQAIQVIEHYLPAPAAGAPAPAPIQVVPKASLPAADQTGLPDAPDVALVPTDTLTALARQQLACQQTGNSLTACQQELADETAKYNAEVATAKTWETAAKGGTKFHRILRVARQAACSAVGAGAGKLVDTQHGAQGAALGAAAGVIVCSLF